MQKLQPVEHCLEISELGSQNGSLLVQEITSKYASSQSDWFHFAPRQLLLYKSGLLCMQVLL